MPAEFLTDEIDFAQYMRDTDAAQNIKGASLFISDAKEKLRYRATGKQTFLPWPKTQGSFEFRKGELTMWAGQNGHGKTDLTTQIALSLMGQDEKVCIASFELKPITTLEKMARMYAGINIFGEEFQGECGYKEIDKIYDEMGEWMTNRLWFYDRYGNADADTVFGMVKYCAKELGVTHIFIDSLMKCIKGEDDYNGQKDFAAELFAIAQGFGIHIHLVHHLKKPPNEADKPDKHHAKGSGALTDILDNLFLIWRNKPKEDDLRANGPMAKRASEPDTMLYCKKQRIYHGNEDNEPTIGLWRHKDGAHYIESHGASAQYFPNYPHIQSI